MRVSLRVSKRVFQGDTRMALTDTRIRATKPQATSIKLSDGGGLHLEVRPTGAKLWRYRFRLHGKENVFAMGAYPALSLADARQARDIARGLIQEGTNPAGQRKLDRLRATHAAKETFKAVALEWAASRDAEIKWSESYRSSVKRILEGDLFPAFGQLPMRQIKAADLLAALRAIEKRGARTIAAKARFLASEIWRYAVATLRADSDLAASLRGAVRMPEHEHHPSLRINEIPAFLAVLANYSGRKETAIALKLLLLVFPRPNELLGASWAEFNLDAALWRIPAQRMKMREEHVIPLPTQAVALLRGLKFLTGDYPHLFPHRDRRHDAMTTAALRQALRNLGYSRKLTPHGFRATASTVLNEMGYRGDWIEKQLAHEERSRSRASYNHAIYLEDRRRMLQDWANVIDEMAKVTTNVTPGVFGRAA
jgi:integrase